MHRIESAPRVPPHGSRGGVRDLALARREVERHRRALGVRGRAGAERHREAQREPARAVAVVRHVPLVARIEAV